MSSVVLGGNDARCKHLESVEHAAQALSGHYECSGDLTTSTVAPCTGGF